MTETVNNLCYICSPYRGEVERNKKYARELTRLALDNGFCPVTVHLYLTEVTDDNIPEERRLGMDAGMEILKNCKYILIGGRHGISEGMKAEIKTALNMGKIMLMSGSSGGISADVNMVEIAKYAEEAGRELIIVP